MKVAEPDPGPWALSSVRRLVLWLLVCLPVRQTRRLRCGAPRPRVGAPGPGARGPAPETSAGGDKFRRRLGAADGSPQVLPPHAGDVDQRDVLGAGCLALPVVGAAAEA